MHKYIHILHICFAQMQGMRRVIRYFPSQDFVPHNLLETGANTWCIWSQIIWANGLLSYMIACVWSFEFVPAQAQHHRLPSRRDQSQEEKHLTEMVRQAGMDELIITIASNYQVAMTAADPWSRNACFIWRHPLHLLKVIYSSATGRQVGCWPSGWKEVSCRAAGRRSAWNVGRDSRDAIEDGTLEAFEYESRYDLVRWLYGPGWLVEESWEPRLVL